MSTGNRTRRMAVWDECLNDLNCAAKQYVCEIDLSRLNSEPFGYPWVKLPDESGVYFVTGNNANFHNILYIGSALSMRDRWYKHKKMKPIQDLDYERKDLHWICCPPQIRLTIELLAIERFQPLMNKMFTIGDDDWAEQWGHLNMSNRYCQV